jgi:cation:H+ antiporter
MIVGLIAYFFYTVNPTRNKSRAIENNLRKKGKLEVKTVVILFVSAFFIYLGARYTIDSVIEISKMLNVGVELIAVSAVALGTSLPELVVSITAARQGKEEIAIGNVLGSNIFNTFAVMGIPALFGSLIIPQGIIMFALPMMIIATLLFFFMMQEKVITRWEGYVLLLFYVFFIGKLFNLL